MDSKLLMKKYKNIILKKMISVRSIRQMAVDLAVVRPLIIKPKPSPLVSSPRPVIRGAAADRVKARISSHNFLDLELPIGLSGVLECEREKGVLQAWVAKIEDSYREQMDYTSAINLLANVAETRTLVGATTYWGGVEIKSGEIAQAGIYSRLDDVYTKVNDQLEKLIKEMKFMSDYCIDSCTAPQIGRLYGEGIQPKRQLLQIFRTIETDIDRRRISDLPNLDILIDNLGMVIYSLGTRETHIKVALEEMMHKFLLKHGLKGMNFSDELDKESDLLSLFREIDNCNGQKDQVRMALVQHLDHVKAGLGDGQAVNRDRAMVLLQNVQIMRQFILEEVPSDFKVGLKRLEGEIRALIPEDYVSLKTRIDALDLMSYKEDQERKPIQAIMSEIDRFHTVYQCEKTRLKERLVRRLEQFACLIPDLGDLRFVDIDLGKNVQAVRAAINPRMGSVLDTRLAGIAGLVQDRNTASQLRIMVGAREEDRIRTLADIQGVSTHILEEVVAGKDVEAIIGRLRRELPVCGAYDELLRQHLIPRGGSLERYFDFRRTETGDLKHWAHLNSVSGQIQDISLTGWSDISALLYRLRTDIEAYKGLDAAPRRVAIRQKFAKEMRSILYGLNTSLEGALIRHAILDKTDAIDKRSRQYCRDIVALNIGDHITMPSGWAQHSVYFSFERTRDGHITVSYSNGGMGVDALNSDYMHPNHSFIFSFEVPDAVFNEASGLEFVREMVDLAVTGFDEDIDSSRALGRMIGGVVNRFIGQVETSKEIIVLRERHHQRQRQREGNCAVANLNGIYRENWDVALGDSDDYKHGPYAYKDMIRAIAEGHARQSLSLMQLRGPINQKNSSKLCFGVK
jgi:hypothetical protein